MTSEELFTAAARGLAALVVVLVDIGTGKIRHRDRGRCPGALGYDARDPECEVCEILTLAETSAAELGAAKDADTVRARLEARVEALRRAARTRGARRR